MFKMNKKIKGSKNLNVPNLRFPEFSGEWEQELLGTTCNVLMCKRILASQTNSEYGVPFYKIGTIGGIPDAYISQELFELYQAKYNYPRKGEVMITCAGTIGKTIMFDGNDSYYQDSNIVWIDNPTNKFDNTFLYHFISKVDWSKLNTTTIVRIYNDDLRQLKISYPTLTEQRKISIFLNLLDERIATQIKIIEKLESLIKGIVETHYSQCDCTKQVRISELGEAFTTMNMSKEDLSEEGNECILYGELFTTYGCVIKDVKSRTHISTDKATTSQSNDLLFPASTTVDAMSLIAPSAICKEEVILGGDLFGVHVNKNYNNEYLSYLINYIYKSKLARYAQGSTIIHLHYSDIKNATLLLPTIEEQNYLAHLMRGVEEKINIEKDMLSKLYSQKAYLLSNLFI